MLARFSRFNGKRHMQMVGQRNVDGLDGWVGQQIMIGTVRLGNTQLGGGLAGPCGIARGDGGYLTKAAFLHGRNNLLYRYIGDAQYAPTNLFRHE